MDEIELKGYVNAEAKVENVGDLRQLVEYLGKYNVPDSTCIDWGLDCLYVMITDDRETPISWIECGDHLTDDVTYDLLIETHKHE